MVSWAYCVRTYNVKLEEQGLPLVSMRDVRKGTHHYDEVLQIRKEFIIRDNQVGVIDYHFLNIRDKNDKYIARKPRKYMVISLN